jgi:hypothetical protein
MLYNNKTGIIVFCAFFLIWAYFLGKDCPCTGNTKCIRKEFYGVQLNHLFLFIIIGMFFPSYFVTFQILGILWELFEHLLEKYPILVTKYFGGCLQYPPNGYIEKNNPRYHYTVYRGIKKPLNPIDEFFNIKNSTLHGWHGSVAELIPNVVGFIIGYYINKYIMIAIKN